MLSTVPDEPVELTVRYHIPLEDYCGGNLIFYQWIPGESDSLGFSIGDFATETWIESTDVNASAEDIARTVNISARALTIQVTGHTERELADYIFDDAEQQRRFRRDVNEQPRPELSRLEERFEQLGDGFLRAAVASANYIILWARTTKGQHWLNEIRYEPNDSGSFDVAFRAKVSRDKTQWVRWYPAAKHTLVIVLGDESRCIRASDWANAKATLREGVKANLTLHLLANAEQLCASESYRSAVIEATTALEMALSRFAARPKAEELLGSKTSRMGIDNLQSRVSHLGFSTTINYLIPLLFDATQFPDELLQRCRDLIELRGVVVHQGKREVDEPSCRRGVQSARAACGILMKYTAS